MTIRTQTKLAGSAVSDDSVGTIAWANPTRVEANDGSYSEAANTSGSTATSERCKCGAFGFSVPSDAPILGLKSNVKVKGTGSGITIVGVTTARSAFASSIAVNKPTGVASGDILILGHVHGVASAQNDPSGFTLLQNQSVTTGRAKIWTKTAGGSEPSTYTVTGTSGSQTIVMVALRNASAPYTSSLAIDGDDTITAPAITTTQVGDLVLGLFLTDDDETWTPPAGMTEADDDDGAMVCSYTPGSTGSTGTKVGDNTGFGTNISAGGLIAFHASVGPAVDEAAGFVLPDGTVSTDDLSKATSWPAAGQVFTYGADDYNPDELDADDVNDTDFGWAHQASILDDGTAGIDYVEIVVRYNASLTITLTTPASEGTVTQPNFTAEATFELDGVAVTMNDTRWRIYSDADGNNLVYDSGSIVSSATSHEIGSGTPTLPWSNALDDTTYYIRVTGTEDGTADPDGSGDPIDGDSGLVEFTTSWTPPPAITGLTATAVTEEA